MKLLARILENAVRDGLTSALRESDPSAPRARHRSTEAADVVDSPIPDLKEPLASLP